MNASAQIAHLVFSNTQISIPKTQKAFFNRRSTEIEERIKNEKK